MYLLINSYMYLLINSSVSVCMSCFHCQTAGLIRLKLSMWCSITQVSTINHTCGCGTGCGFFMATPTKSCFGCQKIINRPIRLKFDGGFQVPVCALLITCGCGNGCCFVIATPMESCFGCQKLIKAPIRLKFGIWILRNWER